MGVMSTRRIYVSIAAIAVIPALLLALMLLKPDFAASLNDTKLLTRESVYIGGATIIAFALFGSILSVGIITDRDKKLDERDLKMVYGGTALIVSVQGLNMLFACCLIFNVFSLAVVTSMTFVSAAIIILGFGQIVGRQLSKPKKSGGGQSGAQCGTQCGADKTETKNGQGEGRTGAPIG